VVSVYWNSATCGTSATWKWHRTVANEQCTTISVTQKWWLNQANGTLTRGPGIANDGDFVPKSGC
jgi:hypothetical protein